MAEESRGGGSIEKALRGKSFDAKRIEVECLDDETYVIRAYPKPKGKDDFPKPVEQSAPNEEAALKIIKKFL